MLRRSICLLLSFISLLRHIALIWQYWGPMKNNPHGDTSYEILSNNSPSFLYHWTGHGVDENRNGMGRVSSAVPLVYHPTKMRMHLRGNNSTASQNYFFQTMKEQEIVFLLCMPSVGRWKLHVFTIQHSLFICWYAQQTTIYCFLISKRST